MAKKFVAQDNEEAQPLRINSSKRFIVNDNNDWQFLFGPDSAFTTTAKQLKVAAEFDKTDFSSIRLAGYLYDPTFGTISNLATCQFRVFLVNTPTWTEQLIGTFTGTQIFNSYFFVDVPAASLSPIDFFGGDTIMIEAVATRLAVTFRERIYVNHLGILDNVSRLRSDVEFLDITKQDL